jgi:hypothetical protein
MLTAVAHQIIGTVGKILRKAAAILLDFGLNQRDLPGGDLAQGRDDFLIVRFDQRTGSLEQLFGPASGAENQFESIRNLFETIFYSYTGHCPLIFQPRSAIVNERVGNRKWANERVRALFLSGQSVSCPFGV